MKNLSRTFNKYIILLLILSIVLSGCDELIGISESLPISEGSQLKVHFIDVGQGDATLIQQINPEHTNNMLIDGGNNGDGEYLVAYLKAQGIDSLDFVIGTHPHADHIGGLDDIINNFHIETLLMPKVVSNTRTFEEVMEAVVENGLSVTTPIPGTKYSLGDAEFTILAPNSEEYSNLNDYSIANRLVYGSNSFMFTGDAEIRSENEMLENFSKRFLTSDVLKVGHHGSSTSNTDEFFDAVSPKYGVISSGVDISYGHPHREVMAKLNSEGIEVFRTDQEGTIIISSDGENLLIETELDATINPNYNDVVIRGLDKIAELVTVENTGENDVDMTGWKLVSVRGNQEFIFPNHILKANSSLTVGGYDSRDIVDFIWEIGGGVWSNSKPDPAELYDEKGNLISVFGD